MVARSETSRSESSSFSSTSLSGARAPLVNVGWGWVKKVEAAWEVVDLGRKREEVVDWGGRSESDSESEERGWEREAWR